MLEKRLTAEGDEGPGDRFGFAGQLNFVRVASIAGVNSAGQIGRNGCRFGFTVCFCHCFFPVTSG